LHTFQSKGIKLKLLNALFNGRFVVVNPTMVEQTGLDRLCTVCETAEEMQRAVTTLMQQEFTSLDIQLRREWLHKEYTNRANAEKLMQYLLPAH
jgi:hypothetical protein